jgi:hypothetical protein
MGLARRRRELSNVVYTLSRAAKPQEGNIVDAPPIALVKVVNSRKAAAAPPASSQVFYSFTVASLEKSRKREKSAINLPRGTVDPSARELEPKKLDIISNNSK